MSKKNYLFSFVLLALFFVSCSETEEVGRYDNWQLRNDAFIDSLENVYNKTSDHGGLNRLELITAPGNYLYYKVKEGTAYVKDSPTPKYTDYVKVHFKGTNILNEYFSGNFTGKDPVIGGTNVSEGDSSPVTYLLSGMTTGWTEALQCMKKEDRWVIYVPWKYGYGSSDTTDPYTGTVTIIGYTNLIFDVKLLDFANEEADLK